MSASIEEKEMRREFVVTDEGGYVSTNVKTDNPEKFASFSAARKRAEELAHETPGREICIYELTATSFCKVELPETSRRHPIEHYS